MNTLWHISDSQFSLYHILLQQRGFLRGILKECKLFHTFDEAILMSTHNICFYGELTKIILELSPNTLLICSTDILVEF